MSRHRTLLLCAAVGTVNLLALVADLRADGNRWLIGLDLAGIGLCLVVAASIGWRRR